MNEQVRFAIIGCGRIAQRHAQHIANNGVLVAVCDIEKEKAQSLGEQYGARVYTDLETLLHEENGNF